MRLRPWFILLLLLVGMAGLTPAAKPVTAAPLAGPGSGWVKANVVGGGCDAQGHCSSEVTPGSPALYEYRPDRESVGRNYNVGANLADHGGYRRAVSEPIDEIRMDRARLVDAESMHDAADVRMRRVDAAIDDRDANGGHTSTPASRSISNSLANAAERETSSRGVPASATRAPSSTTT